MVDNSTPRPQLWTSTALAGVTLVVLIYRTVFAYSRFRTYCMVIGGLILISTITNVLTTYPSFGISAFTESDTLLFTFITVVYLNVLVIMYLDVGNTFLGVIENAAFDGFSPKSRSRQRILKLSSIVTSALGSVLAIILGFLVAIENIRIYHYQAFLTLAIITVLTILYSIISSIIYAFTPLVARQNGAQAAQSQAYAVGVWYLGLIMPILAAHVTFYLYTFSCANPFNNVNKAFDLSFRSVLLLAYGIPPNRAIIRWWRSKMITAHGNSMPIYGIPPRSNTNTPYPHSPKPNIPSSQADVTIPTSEPSSSVL